MKRKMFSLSMVLIFTMSMLFPAGSIFASPANNWNVERYGDVIDIGAKLRAQENDPELRAKLDAQIKALGPVDQAEPNSGSGAEGSGDFTFDGGTKMFLGLDDYKGRYYLKDYTLRSIGEKVEVWVANNLDYPQGDTRPKHVITQAQVDRVRDDFDNIVYPKDTEFFGNPDSHSGANAMLTSMVGLPEDYYVSSDGKERVIVMVDNVRDDQYYEPDYPFFIAGFFSSTYERYFDRNIITIDSKEWETRLEQNFLPTLAHEFQHLIHRDNDPGEQTWINEGMADFAEYLCGYGVNWRHINFFLDHPENSLVSWDEYANAPTGPEVLADYGQALLLQLYLNDHYGRDLIQALAKDTDHGINSVNKILNQFNTGIDFNELFRRFTLALAMDSPQPGNGIYNFDCIDIKVNYKSAAAFAKDGVPAWGADYLVLKQSSKIQNINFDGVDFMPTPWKVVANPLNDSGKVLWGNSGNSIDNWLVYEVDLSGIAAPSLQFEHRFDIENEWDFGFVQVSTDNGSSWNSLANENTSSVIDPDGYQSIKANLPGFCGLQSEWTQETFDLTPYQGQKILLNFRYMTDSGTLGNGEPFAGEPGWYIRNISIPQAGFFEQGSSLTGAISPDKLKGLPPVAYAVSFINEKSLGTGNNEQNYRVLNVDPFNINEAQALQLKEFLSGGNNYMVVWYAAPVGKAGVVDYSYRITTKSEFNRNK